MILTKTTAEELQLISKDPYIISSGNDFFMTSGDPLPVESTESNGVTTKTVVQNNVYVYVQPTKTYITSNFTLIEPKYITSFNFTISYGGGQIFLNGPTTGVFPSSVIYTFDDNTTITAELQLNGGGYVTPIDITVKNPNCKKIKSLQFKVAFSGSSTNVTGNFTTTLNYIKTLPDATSFTTFTAGIVYKYGSAIYKVKRENFFDKISPTMILTVSGNSYGRYNIYTSSNGVAWTYKTWWGNGTRTLDFGDVSSYKLSGLYIKIDAVTGTVTYAQAKITFTSLVTTYTDIDMSLYQLKENSLSYTDIDALYMLRSIVARDYIFAFAVRNLEATDNTYSSKIQLEWDKVDAAVEYVVYRKTIEDAVYTEVVRIPPTSTFYEDVSALVKNKQYMYAVKAVNANGDYTELSAFDYGSVDVVKDITGITATKGLYKDKIIIKWNASDGAKKYNIYKRIEGEPNYVLLAPVASNVLEHIDTDVEAKINYEYTITAFDDFDAETLQTNSDIGYCEVVLDLPSSVWCSNGTHKDHVTISWENNPAAESYHIFRRPLYGGVITEIAEVNAGINTYDDYSMLIGISYIYFIASFSTSLGWSPYSVPVEGHAGELLDEQTKASTKIATYSMFTDEEDQDIIFEFSSDIKPDDKIIVSAMNTNTKEEIFVLSNNIKKLYANIISWNTSRIPIKPQDPINILLKATVEGTNKVTCAILQYKKRYTIQDSAKSSGTNNAWGQIIW